MFRIQKVKITQKEWVLSHQKDVYYLKIPGAYIKAKSVEAAKEKNKFELNAKTKRSQEYTNEEEGEWE